MIQVSGLAKRFGERTAIEGVTLAIPPGEIFGLLGPNGAGKTTTVRMLAGLIAPSAGDGTVAGVPLRGDTHALRQRVGLLTESPGLYDRLTVERNLDFFGQLHGLSLPERTSRVARYLEAVGLLDRRRERAGALSKGMKQRLAIARALLHEPPVLFLDEPTSGLDPEAARTVRDVIGGLKQEGRTIILCTHNLDEADRLCDRIAVVRGRLLTVDTPSGLRRALFGRQVAVRLGRPLPEAESLLRALPGVRGVVADGTRVTLDLEDPERQNPAIVALLVRAGAEVQSVSEVARTLEEVYLAVVGGAGGQAE
jgi:ABC-2 type transport system ATP-binding protein